MRRLIAGTGWKMNMGVAETARYAAALLPRLSPSIVDSIEMFVLPPFTSLHAAREAFAGSPVGIGGQNMHWDAAGAWTGEISAAMLVEAGCRYVELAHSERLQHFSETYEMVRRKLNAAIEGGLTPILCLGEAAEDKRRGMSDDVLIAQMSTALADQPAPRLAEVILAYEPRWAIGAAAAAAPDYVAERHRALRGAIEARYGAATASEVRIVYGGSVTPENGPALMTQREVDGLFVGRAAWTPEGFAAIVAIVAQAAAQRSNV